MFILVRIRGSLVIPFILSKVYMSGGLSQRHRLHFDPVGVRCYAGRAEPFLYMLQSPFIRDIK